MNNVMFSFFISGLAGLSTLLGALIIFIKSDKKENIICYSLSFAIGTMISISILDLIPASFNYLNKTYNTHPAHSMNG